jgi:hypothetical protein
LVDSNSRCNYPTPYRANQQPYRSGRNAWSPGTSSYYLGKIADLSASGLIQLTASLMSQDDRGLQPDRPDASWARAGAAIARIELAGAD